MRRVAAVGIYNDLAAGKAAVTNRAADNKASAGIDQVTGTACQQMSGDHSTDHMLDHSLLDLFLAHSLIMLGGYDDIIN